MAPIESQLRRADYRTLRLARQDELAWLELYVVVHSLGIFPVLVSISMDRTVLKDTSADGPRARLVMHLTHFPEFEIAPIDLRHLLTFLPFSVRSYPWDSQHLHDCDTATIAQTTAQYHGPQDLNLATPNVGWIFSSTQ